MKFYPYKKGGGGAKKSLSHAQSVCVWGGGGMHNKFYGSFNMGAFSHNEGW